MPRVLDLSDLTTEIVPIHSVVEHPQNVRQGDVESIKDSIRAHGQYVPIVVQASTGYVIKGNHTHRAAVELGRAEVAVVRVDVDDDQAIRMLLVDNVTSDRATMDQGGLAGLLASLNNDLTGTGYTTDDLSALVAGLATDLPMPAPQGGGGPLSDRFIVAPMSVLNARSGPWRDRRRAWAERGMVDSGGRAGTLAMNPGARTSDYYGHKERLEQVLGHTVTQAEIGKYLGHMHTGQLEKTGTSAFDPVLAEVLLSWYSPPGGRVLDPFAGGPTRGLMSQALGRSYLGVDLSAEQVDYDRARAVLLDGAGPVPVWVVGDSSQASTWETMPPEADMVLTCPPYADLEHYSDDPADLSNMSIEQWDAGQGAALRHACARLIPGGFVCVVIGEARGGAENSLYGLVGRTQRHLTEAGCSMWGHYILLTPISGAALVTAKAFGASRSPIRVHQHVLVARRRGGPKRVADQWGLLTGVDDALAALVADDEAEAGEP